MIPTKAVGGGRKLMTFCTVPWEMTRRWRPGFDSLLLSGWYTVFKVWTNISSYVLGHTQKQTSTQPPKRVCPTEMFDLKESLIMGWLGFLGRRDEWFSPGESAENRESGFQRESQTREVRVTHMIHVWPDRKKAKNNSSSHGNSQTARSR